MKYFKECAENEADYVEEDPPHNVNNWSKYNFKIAPYSPPQIIDLSNVAGNVILMEFSHNAEVWYLGHLTKADDNGHFIDANGTAWNRCRFANMWNVHHGGKCPLPDGVDYEFIVRGGRTKKKGDPGDWEWVIREDTGILSQIAAYRPTGLLPNFRHSWEIGE